MVIFAGLFGLIMGSFMNVLIYRLPRGISIVLPPSSCTSCGARINWYDNIPLLSYLILRGKCRRCGSRISVFYPVVEVILSLIFILIFIQFGTNIERFKFCFFSFMLLAAAFTDLKTSVDKNFSSGVIPVVYSAAGVIGALVFAVLEGRFINALSGWAAGYLVLFIPAYIYQCIRGYEGMGDGDFTLFAFIGSFTGPEGIPAVLSAASLIGVASGIVAIAITGNRKYPIPFAPSLALGGLIYIFFEDFFKIAV